MRGTANCGHHSPAALPGTETEAGTGLAKLTPEREPSRSGLRRAVWFFYRHPGVWLGAVILVVFFPAAGGAFLSWGDHELSARALPVVNGLTQPALLRALHVPAPWDGCCGPVAALSHMLDFQLFGPNPATHHLTNVWLHVLNTVLMLSAAKRLAGSLKVALVVAVLFGLQLQAVPAVAWVAQRRILLTTTFVLGAVLCWMRYRRLGLARYLALAVGLALLAGMCWSASAVILMAALLAWRCCVSKGAFSPRWRFGNSRAREQPGSDLERTARWVMPAGFGVGWFLLCGLVAVLVCPRDAFVRIHWSYLGGAGLALSLACALTGGLQATGHFRWLRFLLVPLVLILAWTSRAELARFKDGEKLLSGGVARARSGWPGWRVWHAMGLHQASRGSDFEARTSFRNALACQYDARTLLEFAKVEMRRGRARAAQTLLGEVLREGTSCLRGQAHGCLAWLAEQEGDETAAVSCWSCALAEDAADVMALTALASIRATSPNPTLRNGPEAVDLARRATELTGSMELRSIAALAAAHAELGQFAEAERLGLKALIGAWRLGDTNEAAVCAEQLRSYEAKKPWRKSERARQSGVSPDDR